MKVKVESEGTKLWQRVASELASPVHYCANVTDCTENRRLLTGQALPLSKEAGYCVFLGDCSCCLTVVLLK